jgi:F0F1-type ATP synthase membrane subunit b/b'
MKKTLVSAVILLVLTAGFVFAARPVRNVSPSRHPNIAAAQRLVRQAFEKINAAQKANEWDMNGHAQKAKELLDQVNNELKEAAEAANQNQGK